jgi:hypothetical protein
MRLWWVGACLTVVSVVGCEAKIEGRSSLSAQSGGDVMADEDEDAAGRAAAGSSGSRSPRGSAGASSSDSGGASAQAGSGSPPVAGTGTSMGAGTGGGAGTGMPMEPEPNPNVGGPYDLGELPPGFMIAWPAEPTITREVEVRTVAEFERAASMAGTRVLIRAGFGGGPSGFVNTSASDLEIVADPGVSIDAGLGIGGGERRVRVIGGHYQTVLTSVGMSGAMSEDVLFDGVTVEPSEGNAFNLSGYRIAVLRSTANAPDYCVYADAAPGVPNSDFILAGNVFDSANEATVRLIDVTNSATVDNRLTNNAKHNYRIHGTTAQSYAARNVLIVSGTMLGTQEGDQLGEAWFNDNVFYHMTPDLFHPDAARVDVLHAHGNTAYTDEWDCFYCPDVPAAWDLQDNQVLAYQPPP